MLWKKKQLEEQLYQLITQANNMNLERHAAIMLKQVITKCLELIWEFTSRILLCQGENGGFISVQTLYDPGHCPSH